MNRRIQRLQSGEVVVGHGGPAAGMVATLADLLAWVGALVEEYGPAARFALDCPDDAYYEVSRAATPEEVAEFADRRAALAGELVQDARCGPQEPR